MPNNLHKSISIKLPCKYRIKFCIPYNGKILVKENGIKNKMKPRLKKLKKDLIKIYETILFLLIGRCK